MELKPSVSGSEAWKPKLEVAGVRFVGGLASVFASGCRLALYILCTHTDTYVYQYWYAEYV